MKVLINRFKVTFGKLRIITTGVDGGASSTFNRCCGGGGVSHCRRFLSTSTTGGRSEGEVADNKKSYSFITTPIFYVNSKPHIGHLYTSVIADAYHRFQKIRHRNVLRNGTFLFTGTDEHGIKIEKAAKLAGCKTVMEHCNSVSKEFLNMCNHFSIDYSGFIRTTDDHHKEAVSHFWNRLLERGHIYKSHYEGWYCEADEAFVPESQVTEKADGNSSVKISMESGHRVEWSSEENYMFKLSSQMENVRYWIKNSNPILPEKFNVILMRMAEEDLQDLSVSRLNTRLTWGIPVPNDPTQVIYVWLDALTNYLTVTGYPHSRLWPPTLQIVGKDILKFHGIYWPAFLIAAGMEPPRQLLCHSHWTVDNKKMSKSLGNVVDPMQMSETYGTDGLRYFLLREGTPHSDANFNEEKMRRYINAELADTLGNLLNRCTAKAINPSQTWPATNTFNESELSTHGQHLLQSLKELPDKVEDSFETLNFYRGLEHIMTTIRLANAFVEDEKPWALAKLSPENPQLLNMLNLVFETLRSTAIMMYPIIPNLSTLSMDRLNIPLEERSWESIQPFLWDRDRTSSNRKLGEFRSVFYSRVKQVENIEKVQKKAKAK